ncbi:MAG: multiheme c-type cytochrome [Planctomycetaceae bacterium]
MNPTFDSWLWSSLTVGRRLSLETICLAGTMHSGRSSCNDIDGFAESSQFGLRMSPQQRCLIASTLGGLAFFVGPLGSGFVHAADPVRIAGPLGAAAPVPTAAPAQTAAPSRMPAIDRELLKQLPHGCTGSWATLEPPLEAMPLEVCGSAITPTSGHPSAAVRSNPFAHPLPARPVAMPQRLAQPTPPAEDELLLEGDDGGDSLLDEPLVDPLDDIGPGEDPLSNISPEPDGVTSEQKPAEDRLAAELPARAAIDAVESQYPSAQTCAKCHPTHYDQWRVSGHAYAAVSPMFNRFEQAMQELTQGTVGSFCVRCHAPIATQLCTPPSATILDAVPVVREGITCVACHRIKEAVGRTNGDRRIEPGDIHAPIYGSTDGQGVHEALSQAAKWKLKPNADSSEPGQPMHQHCGPFEPIDRSDFCAPCHQVAVHPGISLEIVHAQYRSGPAHAKGITCQQCHMGAVPGKPSGYEFSHIAEISSKKFGEPRKQSNHMFWGPGYSIAHPGLFPHNLDANRFTPRQWLAFEYRSGWGTPEFEKSVPADAQFPPPWDNADDRIDGRKIIDANLLKLDEKRGAATLTLSAAAQVNGPMFDRPPALHAPLRFHYQVCNLSEGHNMPTGSLGAQPQMWLNVALIDPQGRRIWETGYLDRNGDLADLQSVEVNHHRLHRDSQLFNLQSKFLINNVRGTDREAPVPLNFSLDQLVFLRPGAVPVSVLNHPPLIRMEAHSIPPLDSRMARYVVPAELINQPGAYRLSVRLRSRPEPPYFMRLVGATPEMIRRLNENIIDLETDSQTFMVDGPVQAATPTKYLLR